MLRTIFFPSHRQFSHRTIVETMREECEEWKREMNPAAMTIINPRKKYWPSRDRTSDLLFSSLQHYRLRFGARQWSTRIQNCLSPFIYRRYRLSIWAMPSEDGQLLQWDCARIQDKTTESSPVFFKVPIAAN